MTKNNAIRLIKEAGWHGDLIKKKIVADLASFSEKKASDYYEIGSSNRAFGRPCTCERCLSI